MSWVGGDLAGLSGLGNILETTPSAMEGIANALSSSVGKLAHDASWSGRAATNFNAAWTLSSSRIGAVQATYVEVGGVVSGLANELQGLEDRLYRAATDAQVRGAQIGENGEPLPLVITGDPDSPEALDAAEAQSEYNEIYENVLHLAQGERLKASAQIQSIATAVIPVEIEKGIPWASATTLGGLVKSLFSIPYVKREGVIQRSSEQIAQLQAELKQRRKDLKSAVAAYEAKGLKLPKSDSARTAHLKTVKELKAKSAALSGALEADRNGKISNVLNKDLGDLARSVHGGAGLAELPKGLKFLGKVPVLDIALAGAVGHFQSVDDIEKGWSPETAYSKNMAANLGGVAAGTVALAMAPVSAPVGMVVAGAAVVGWGVGSLGNAISHENWEASVHDRGVVSGVWHSSMNVLATTGGSMYDDIANVSGSIGKGVSNAWNKVFG